MDILFIVGESGSGKTTLQRAIEKHFNLERHKSVTTRPRRLKEDDSAYEFVSNTKFCRLWHAGDLIECARHSGYSYGMRAPDDNQVMVLTPEGLAQAKKWCIDNHKRTCTIYLTCSEGERLQRIMHRGESHEYALQRITADRYFSGMMSPGVFDWRLDSTGHSHKEILHQALSRLKTISFFIPPTSTYGVAYHL